MLYLAQTLTVVPLLFCQGLPCVQASTAQGQHLKLLIDSGDQASTLDNAAARSLASTPIPGHAEYHRATLAGLKLGAVALGDVKVLVTDLATSMKKNQMPTADGTLAYTAFADRLIELDYKRHELRISAPLTQPLACTGSCGEMSLITFGQHGPPIIVGSGFAVNGHTLRAQIDTLYSGTMLIYPQAVAGLGLTEADKTQSMVFVPYTDGGVTMRRATAASEDFGGRTLKRKAPLYFATPGVHVPDGMFEGTIGAALLAHRVLRMDFHDHWVSIEG